MVFSKSKIFLSFCLSFIFGIATAPHLSFSSFLKSFFILGATVLIFVFWRNKKIIICSLCLVIFVLGIWRYDLAKIEPAKNHLANYNNQEEILFEGKIVEEPDIRTSQTKLVVEAEKIFELSKTERKEIKKELGKNLFYEDLVELPKDKIKGKTLLNLPRHPEYQYGDQILVFATIKKPENPKDSQQQFSYKEYLARENIYSLSYYPKILLLQRSQGNYFLTFLFKIKKHFEEVLIRTLPEPHVAFLGGLLLGAKKAIPDDLMEKFNRTGMTHIVALSGYNISIIIAAVSFLILRYFSRKISFWFSLFVIFLFVVLTGMQASCLRAAIMGSLAALARTSGRLSNVTNSLAFAAAGMLFVNPKILAIDLGFQLSFLATLGIVYFSPYVERFLKWLPEFFQIRETALMTVCAQIFVIPKILLSFSRISFVSFFTNILIVPVIPATMLLGFLTGTAGLVWPFLGKVFGFFAYSFLNYEMAVIDFFAKVPYASIQFGEVGKWLVWVYFIVVAGIYVYVKWREKLKSAE